MPDRFAHAPGSAQRLLRPALSFGAAAVLAVTSLTVPLTASAQSVDAQSARQAGAGEGAGSAGSLGSVSSASSDSGTPGSIEAWTPVPEPERFPERYLPDPAEDPWYDRDLEFDKDAAPGTILDVRPVELPSLGLDRIESSWQVLFRSNDTNEDAQIGVATVVLPKAKWDGPGPRPLLASSAATDSLGLACQPSATLRKGIPPTPPNAVLDQRFLDDGYALVIPDHQGPKAAYAAGRQAGHIVLDSIRAARSFVPPGEDDAPLEESKIAQLGFSGGAIAAGWAAQIQPTYAPELEDDFVGTSIGGVPADFGALMTTMDGYWGPAGIFRAAVLGVAREYPALYRLLNPVGDVFAYTSRNSCSDELHWQGVVPIPIDDLTLDRHVLADPEVRRILVDNALGPNPDRPKEIPSQPMQVWQGDSDAPIVPNTSIAIDDYWVPTWAVKRMVSRWCEAGVRTQYQPVPGEHLMSSTSGIEPAYAWIDARMRDLPLEATCH